MERRSRRSGGWPWARRSHRGVLRGRLVSRPAEGAPSVAAAPEHATVENGTVGKARITSHKPEARRHARGRPGRGGSSLSLRAHLRRTGGTMHGWTTGHAAHCCSSPFDGREVWWRALRRQRFL